MRQAPPSASRVALALNQELSAGRHGASARLELHDGATGRVALLALRGWIDARALSRLKGTLDDLASRGASQLLLDCAQLRSIGDNEVPGLVAALERFKTRAGAYVVCGLSHELRDLFRVAGCESRLRFWPAASELLGRGPSIECRECPS